MENEKTIIGLLCIIIILLIVVVVMFSPLMAKEASNLAISKNKVNAGDSLIVSLTDNQGVLKSFARYNTPSGDCG